MSMYEEDYYDDYYEQQLLERRMMVREDLDKLSNRDFLLTILETGKKYRMNIKTEDREFPAYDIAEKAHQNNWELTKKQRRAITNIYLHVEHPIVY